MNITVMQFIAIVVIIMIVILLCMVIYLFYDSIKATNEHQKRFDIMGCLVIFSFILLLLWTLDVLVG